MLCPRCNKPLLLIQDEAFGAAYACEDCGEEEEVRY